MSTKARTVLYALGALLAVLAVGAVLLAGEAGGAVLLLAFAAAFALVGIPARHEAPALWASPQR